MDRLDYKILSCLQEHGDISMAELSEQIGLSLSACHRRVKLLEASGVINRYAAQQVGRGEDTRYRAARSARARARTAGFHRGQAGFAAARSLRRLRTGDRRYPGGAREPPDHRRVRLPDAGSRARHQRVRGTVAQQAVGDTVGDADAYAVVPVHGQGVPGLPFELAPPAARTSGDCDRFAVPGGVQLIGARSWPFIAGDPILGIERRLFRAQTRFATARVLLPAIARDSGPGTV